MKKPSLTLLPGDKKPDLSLVSGKDLEDEAVLIALFKKLMGRDPTEQELKEAGSGQLGE